MGKGIGKQMNTAFRRAAIAVIMVMMAGGTVGVAAAQSPPLTAHLQAADEVLAQDAGEYARLYDVPIDEAMHRLRAQEETVATTDRLQEVYGDRLAGLYIEHRPAYRIVVVLTGSGLKL